MSLSLDFPTSHSLKDLFDAMVLNDLNSDSPLGIPNYISQWDVVRLKGQASLFNNNRRKYSQFVTETICRDVLNSNDSSISLSPKSSHPHFTFG
jgi:hypothetical protein